MDKTIVTALLVMAGVISAVFVFNSIYPAISQTGDAFASMQGRYDERLKTQIQIIFASRTGDDVVVWVKNIGSLPLKVVESSDLFFGPEDNFQHIPYGTGTPHWEYAVENDDEWKPTTTLRINIIGATSLDPGNYLAKLVVQNGVSDTFLFSW